MAEAASAAAGAGPPGPDSRVALVTGASGVVGSQTALALRERGYRVALHGRNTRRLARTVARFPDPHDTALALGGDLTEPETAGSIVDAVLGRFGRLDAVVAAAGVFPKEPFEGPDEELWDAVLALNLTSQARLLRRALKPLRASRPGVVVLLGSEPVTRPVARPNQEAYYASKGGLLGLARGLQASLLDEPVNTVVVHPDWTLPDDEITDPAAQVPAGALGAALGHVVEMARLVRLRELTLYPMGNAVGAAPAEPTATTGRK